MEIRQTRNLVVFWLLTLFFFFCVFAVVVSYAQDNNSTDNSTDNSTVINDNSVHHHINLGDGNSIIIFGDGNTIYLPANDPVEIVPNQVTFSEENVRIVLMDTEILVDGVSTRYKKIVLVLGPDKWDLVWWEQ